MNTLFELPTEINKPPVTDKRQFYITLQIDGQEMFVWQNTWGSYDLRPVADLKYIRPRRWNDWQYCQRFMKAKRPSYFPGWDGTYKIVEWTE